MQDGAYYTPWHEMQIALERIEIHQINEQD